MCNGGEIRGWSRIKSRIFIFVGVFLRFSCTFSTNFWEKWIFGQKSAKILYCIFNGLQKMWEKSENLLKNWLDVCGRFVYNSRHTDTVQPERLSGSERVSEARPGEAVIKFTDFLRRQAELRNSLPDTTFRVGRRRGKREGRKRSWRVPWPAPRWSSAELRSEVTRYWWIWKMVHWSSNF